ncbi:MULTISPECIES: transglutaminase-like domain-containing protein [Methanobacterium]|uniref:Transglutaminase-like domain-containing protein n=1 Tax=Methanobacterium veterum TaxID=408577 RepID=A0A9E5DH36_9EURY|nr:MULTISPECIES: transglutaminase-like domain-containing protein [Methanobacterium]MCZ3365261.1 transglutaminase-like domain-containing protein [Methanobacterium veterum]MCZ3373016.1 transglutaminase-like domain-containing protein [Methanobacterium veterum]
MEDIYATEDIENTTYNLDQEITENSNLTNTNDTTDITNSTNPIDITSSNTTSTDYLAAGGETKASKSLSQYVQTTKNCQVTNSQIQALAKSITSGKSSAYDKAVAIFNWVRDKLGYSFYYNTKYGAVGTLNAKTGNCVDTAHLLIALERAAGIPARYVHGYCKFSSGNWYGHVWAQIYIEGKWYNADATSYRNTFGVIKNWNTKTAKIYDTYASLPF